MSCHNDACGTRVAFLTVKSLLKITAPRIVTACGSDVLKVQPFFDATVIWQSAFLHLN